MTSKTILLGLSAIGALVLAGSANAQIVGGAGGTVGGAVGGVAGRADVAGQARGATPAIPATPAVPGVRAPATPAVPSARAAGSAGADASGQVGRSDFAAGTVVRDSAGVQIGTIMDPDPSARADGRVTIKTSTGFITVPRGSLTLQGDVAVSKDSAAELQASGKAKAQ